MGYNDGLENKPHPQVLKPDFAVSNNQPKDTEKVDLHSLGRAGDNVIENQQANMKKEQDAADAEAIAKKIMAGEYK